MPRLNHQLFSKLLVMMDRGEVGECQAAFMRATSLLTQANLSWSSVFGSFDDSKIKQAPASPDAHTFHASDFWNLRSTNTPAKPIRKELSNDDIPPTILGQILWLSQGMTKYNKPMMTISIQGLHDSYVRMSVFSNDLIDLILLLQAQDPNVWIKADVRQGKSPYPPFITHLQRIPPPQTA